MKGRAIDELVYEFMFPKPRTSDPQNFQTLLHRHLILEVRQEVHAFYGHLDTQEAKYPGLDYCHRIHRIRLSRWPWHRRLFRAFDGLRLTNSEIAGLTKWEGTKWAKERFERDSGVIIRDTAADGIPDWVEPEDRPQPTEDSADENMEGEDDSEEELTSIGVPLNEQLFERAARHEAGDTSEPLDEEWEQWLKTAIDSGQFPFLTDEVLEQSSDAHLIPQALFPPRMLSAARAGHWQEIPDIFHGMLRQILEREAVNRSLALSGSEPSETRSSTSIESIMSRIGNWRRTYSNLRLPVAEASSNVTSEVRLQRTAQPGA
ncbi:Uu.00g029290.m01.CDS01 [Anthostomella pinea]|uniref:Uu.00g029290.m01.CDS01 n=1 Tax=Anthostomella pinea TaxID=933095 RepID=A0AAI8V835_9PEZI|nr:Uu.00g029290.m01.CDS01 [Anthostomella pinea]